MRTVARGMLVAGAALVVLPGVTESQEPGVIRLKPANGRLADGLTEITAVRELSDGRVLIADNREARLVVADFADGAMEDFLRKGPGPEEFTRTRRIFALRGDTSLADDQSGWIFLEGTLVIRMTLAWLVGMVSPEFAGLDQRGRMLELRADRFGKEGDPSVRRVGATFNAAESLHVLVHRDVVTNLVRSTSTALRPPPSARPGDTLATLRGA